ncbi:hypothetical protein PARPLA_00157 [Rhodobacteraceae bacterium THAF1]|nr:hypothetical protein FIU81_16475 [Palleronia sp. THAF1]VDC16817.1 hypothetical protein PARPLA_00157 [Rhodobacteraceae bacterium THAF1]
MRWLPLLLAIIPAIASAETRVRTAEHETFTRVVIDYAVRPDYNLEINERQVQVQTDKVVHYDLSDVYRRIDRTRVTQLSKSEAALLIDLGCDCTVTQTELPSGGLVIDIGDPDRTARPIRGSEAQQELTALQEPPSEVSPASLVNSTVDLPMIPGLLTREAAEPSPMAKTLRESLIADLLDNSISGVSLAPLAKQPVIADAKPEDGAGSISTGQIAVDTRSGQYARGSQRIPARATCAPVLLLSIPDWLAGPKTLDPASSNPEILNSTAKKLIINGFGVEAAAILDPSMRTSDDAVLLELAQLVDAPIEAPLIVAMSECGDLATLFAALADPPTPPARPGALVAAISSLPNQLRNFYGDRVTKQMRKIGQIETAELVMAAVGRTDPAQTGPVLTPNEIGPSDRRRGNADLEMEIALRTPDAPSAIAALIMGYINRAEPVPQDIFDQASIILRESEGVARFELERAMFDAWIAEEDVQSANTLIFEVANRSKEEAVVLRERLAKSVLEFSSDADFLRGLAVIAVEPLANAELRIGLADRSLQLAMPHLAVAILMANRGVPSRPERILLAQAHLDRQDWAKASDILGPMTGADVDSLRARLPAPPVSIPVERIAEPAERVPPTIRARSSKLVSETESLREEWSAFLEP